MTQAPLLFLLLLRQIISQRYRVCRGNPGPPPLGEHPEQRPRPLFSAVLRCFWKHQRVVWSHPHGHNDIKPEASCQFDTCRLRIYLNLH